ncbi:MAG: hypothetical protein WBP97_17175, partial [Candidatus Sulfotelmatobacter sp.]
MQVSTPKTPGKSHRWALLGIILCLFVAVGAVAVWLVIDRAEPILRARVVQTLSNRFQSRVELKSLGVSVVKGLEVYGSGLKVYGATDPNPYEAGVQPLISIREFHFHTGIRNLFRPVVRVDTVYVKGMDLNIPPKESRRAFTNKMKSQTRKISVVVDHFVCQDTNLLINNSN